MLADILRVKSKLLVLTVLILSMEGCAHPPISGGYIGSSGRSNPSPRGIRPAWTVQMIAFSRSAQGWGLVKRYSNGFFTIGHSDISYYNGHLMKDVLSYSDTTILAADFSDTYFAYSVHPELISYQLKQELFISRIKYENGNAELVDRLRFLIPFSQSITGIKFLSDTRILITSFLEYGIVDIRGKPHGGFDITFRHYPFIAYNTQQRLQVVTTSVGGNAIVYGGLGVSLLYRSPGGSYGLKELFYLDKRSPLDVFEERDIETVAMADTSLGAILLPRRLVYYRKVPHSSGPDFVWTNYIKLADEDSVSAEDIVGIAFSGGKRLLCLTSSGIVLMQDIKRKDLLKNPWVIVARIPVTSPKSLNVINANDIAIAGESRLFLLRRETAPNIAPSHEREGNVSPHFVVRRSAQPSSSYGVGIGDLDNDGTEAVYLVDAYDANRLFTTIPDRFANFVPTNLAAQRGIAGRVTGGKAGPLSYDLDIGVAIGDLNEDGAEDLIVTNLAYSNSLYLNNGEGYFKDATKEYHFNVDMQRSEGAVLGDVNNDGYLDVFGTSFFSSNRLFINNHGISLDDKTEKYGLSSGGRSISAVFGDVNNDGYLDLYVGNWMKGNRLYINDGHGKFIDRTKESGVGCGDLKETNSVFFADLNNDGYLDLFVGNRAGGDKLFLNNGDGTFRDVTKASGLGGNYHTYGAVFGDFDNDGWQDIAIACLGGIRIFRNLGVDSTGQIHFKDVTSQWIRPGVIPAEYNTGLATADFGNKGLLDLVMNQNGGYTYFLINKTRLNGRNNYLSVKVEGDESNRDAVGATLKLFYKDSLLGYREVSGGFGYASSSSKIQHFGTGSLKGPFSLVVYYPASHVTRRLTVYADSFVTVKEHTGLKRDFFLAKKDMLRLLYGKGFVILGIELILLLAILLSLTSFAASKLRVRRKKGRWGRAGWTPVVISSGIFYVIKIATVESMTFYFGPAYFIVNSTNLFTSELLPLLGSCMFAVSFLFVVRSRENRNLSMHNVLDSLLTVLKRFDHGEGMLVVLYRLSLLVENLTQDATGFVKEGLERIESAYSEYKSAVHPEILRIYSLLNQLDAARMSRSAGQLYSAIADSVLSTDEQIVTSCERLFSNSPIKSRAKLKGDIILSVKNMRETLSELRATIRSNFSTDVVEAIELAIMKFREQEPDFIIDFAKNGGKINAIVSPPDFNEVLNIVIQNAIDELRDAGRGSGIIRISADSGDGRATIRIEDNGRGVAQDAIEKIFKGEITTKQGGHGMGLSIAVKCLEKYEGTISCRTAELGGAAFTIELKSI